ncbi:hypothetical protein QYM36_008886 [Artemia franciscana]|uniref:Uncharacterized protein n=1 Tax=Artemia franciscana TaxID=6661 RepID=A0AA88L6A4_ARTSF|nr:hypothetical protein QYM36_008886 [Artemia franciscana]
MERVVLAEATVAEMKAVTEVDVVVIMEVAVAEAGMLRVYSHNSGVVLKKYSNNSAVVDARILIIVRAVMADVAVAEVDAVVMTME